MEKLKIKIQKMKKRDISEIMKIEKSAYGDFHWSESGFDAEIDNALGHYFVIRESNTNTLVGYCGFWAVLEEAHITTIATHPDWRGKKLGEVLLQQMIELGYKNEIKWFTLEVRISNYPAQELYKKYNFQSFGLRKKYYQDTQEDALIMWTENIWHSKFKDNFSFLREEIKNLIEVTENEFE